MDHASLHFGKPIGNLSYADIIAYFQIPRAESATLEFKSSPPRSNFDAGLGKVARGISSFLNANGGILVWGAPTASKQAGGSADEFSGDLCPLREYVPKDTVINRINSLISPLPAGLQVQILRDGENCLYIFEVQESRTKPHMFGHSYYIRLDGQSHPAPHYLVDALMKQVTYPDIAGVIAFHSLQESSKDKRSTEMAMTIGLFNFSPFQNEENISYKLTISGGYLSNSLNMIQTRNPAYAAGGFQVVHENAVDVLHFGTPKSFLERVAFNDQTLRMTKNMLYLDLSFGGKRSPAKISSYVLDLSKYWVEMDPKDAVIYTKENILFADKEQKSREDELQDFKNQ
ncbi:helix-turn-helix domain-containing protein [Mucilaginibacter sp. NFR10]|uniref:AlbA family DNA-binding domain-containing protein n=1 Tax=Mucilaginibacter sp. NFR10 TaxID=1566292 RepID=UPI000871548C|nr:ATP-binding protein [Mucilaginibacter sp. NFR10]SCW72002.1 Putative DNA-binding domain-containing protein [Mucilaginibacter sp. NFR10]